MSEIPVQLELFVTVRKAPGKIHAGHVATCERLRKVLSFLRERGERGATTLEIVERCQALAVSATVAELRENGCVIECEYRRETDGGSRVYRYRLVSEP